MKRLDTSSISRAIRWHEGMLLAPQHFQQQSRRLEGLIHHQVSVCTPYAWGVVALDIDESALARGAFRLRRLHALMPDGMMILEPPPDEVDLLPYQAEAQDSPLRIHLAVPAAQADQRKGPMARYLRVADEVVHDQDPEASERMSAPVPRLMPNVKVLPGTRGVGGHELVPLAEVSFDGSMFRLDAYVPPHLAVVSEPWCEPLFAECRQLIDKLRGKAAYLLQGQVGGGAQLQLEMKLHHIIAGLPAFELLLESGEAHPFQLYTALCTLGAHVSAIAALDALPRFPLYAHEAPMTVFKTVFESISEALDEGVPESFDEIRLEGKDHDFTVKFDDTWRDRTLVLGFMGGTRDELIAWAKDCYVGTADRLETMNLNRDVGVRRERKDYHEGLRKPRGAVLYTLKVSEDYVTPGEQLHVYNPIKSADLPAPTRVLLYVERRDDR